MKRHVIVGADADASCSIQRPSRIAQRTPIDSQTSGSFRHVPMNGVAVMFGREPRQRMPIERAGFEKWCKLGARVRRLDRDRRTDRVTPNTSEAHSGLITP